MADCTSIGKFTDAADYRARFVVQSEIDKYLPNGRHSVDDARINSIIAGIVAWAKSERPDMVVVGPEAPLVAGLGATLREAVDRAYSGVAKITFDGMFYRRDIAHRAFER